MHSNIGDKEFVDQRIFKKIIYNDLISINQNNTSQVKSKFKLCISLSSLSESIIEGRIFGVSATKRDWHDTVECSIVSMTDYSRCSSTALRTITSAYTAGMMEVIGYDQIRAKIEDTQNGFNEAARLGNTKYKEVSGLFDRYLDHEISPTRSVLAIKTLAASTEEVDSSVLENYGVTLEN
jgi:hypothetical protein